MPEHIGRRVAPGDAFSETLFRSPGCSETVAASGCCFPSSAQLRFYVPCGPGLVHSREHGPFPHAQAHPVAARAGRPC